MQHEPQCPALGAREPRQGDYDDDEAGVVQVLSHQVVLDTRNVVTRVESCRRRRRRRAYSEVAHNTWHSGDSNSSSSSIREKRYRQADERHEVVVQEVQVARQKEETETKVDYYERIALPLLLSPSRELLADIVVAATTAAAATVAVAAVSVGRGTLVQGNF